MVFAIHWHESAMGVHVMVLKPQWASQPPEGLLDLCCSSPEPWVFDSAAQGRGLRICISDSFPGDAAAAAVNSVNRLVGLLVFGVRWFRVCTPALHLATCGTLTVSLTSVSHSPSHVIWIIKIVKHGEAYLVDVCEVFSKVEHFQAPTVLKIIILSGATTFLEK